MQCGNACMMHSYYVDLLIVFHPCFVYLHIRKTCVVKFCFRGIAPRKDLEIIFKCIFIAPIRGDRLGELYREEYCKIRVENKNLIRTTHLFRSDKKNYWII